MSLCYDFQKSTMVTFAIVATSLTIGLVTLAYGQEINWTQEALNAVDNATDITANDTGQEINYTELVKNTAGNIFKDFNKIQQEVNKTNIDNLTMQRNQLEAKQQSLENMVNYCFEHVDRPNPIQDLIDKGFVDSEYRNITCKDIKMTYDINQERITELQNKIDENLAIEFNKMLKINIKNQKAKDDALLREQDKSSPYASCLKNTDTTLEECFRMFAGIK